MAPAVYLALVLLFFPTVILAELLHVPVTRRQIKSRDWNFEANRLRKRYGYPASIPLNHRTNSRAVVGIDVLDQVDTVIVLFLYQLIARIGYRC